MVVGKGKCWTCWSGSGLSPTLPSCVRSAHHMFGEGQVGSWTALEKDSSDHICLVMVVESVSYS